MNYQEFERTLSHIAKHIEYLHGQIRNVAYDVYVMELQNTQEDVDLDILMFRKAEMRMYIIQLNDAELRYYQIKANNPDLCIALELDSVDKLANPDQLPSWELYDHFQ